MSNTPTQQAPKGPTAANQEPSDDVAAKSAPEAPKTDEDGEAPKPRKRPSEGLVVGKKYTFDSIVGRLQDPTSGEWFGEDGPKRTSLTPWIAMQMDADAPRISVVIEE